MILVKAYGSVITIVTRNLSNHPPLYYLTKFPANGVTYWNYVVCDEL